MSIPPDSTETLLAGRRFENLSEAEKVRYRQIREGRATERAQAIVDNLNRNVLKRHSIHMAPDLPERVAALYSRLAAFPEAHTPAGPVLKSEAFTAFLDLRQLYEREIRPALDELKRLQSE